MSEAAVVLSGGEPVVPAVAARLPTGSLVIAADSGYRDARALGLPVDVLVGDLDSITADDLAHAEGHGVTIERYPTDKDATDLELALDTACRQGARRLTVVSGGGGRLDHLLGGLALLASPAYADVAVDGWIGRAHVQVLHGPGTVSIHGCCGDTVTLLATGAEAGGITTNGLRYPLTGETLRPGETRGISNELVERSATVALVSGTLIVIRPDALPC